MDKLKNRHFLQSSEWALFQKALGHHVIERSGQHWQYMAIVEVGDGTIGSRFKRLYCPYGPYAESEAALAEALHDIEQEAKKRNVDYVRVEPTSNNLDNFTGQTYGYKKQARDFQPGLTLHIDITLPTDDILLGMSKTNRYLWHKSERNGLKFKISYELADLEHFLLMMQETADRTGTTFHRGQYYTLLLEILGPTKNVGVAYAYHDDDILVGVLFADDFVAKTRYYLYAGSFDSARKFSANSPLVSFLLLDAHQKDFKVFDFFGVAPEHAVDHKWAGFSKFKRSFGGTDFTFAGTWEKPIRRLRYKIMQFARALKP